MLLHAKTRKKGLIDKFSELRLSIPYKRVIQLSEHLGTEVLPSFEKENIVYPTNMKKSLFTTAAVDNILTIIRHLQPLVTHSMVQQYLYFNILP